VSFQKKYFGMYSNYVKNMVERAKIKVHIFQVPTN
jgi:hypothetical protein